MKQSMNKNLLARLQQEALTYFHNVQRPVLLGEMSLVLDFSLDRTEEVLLSLVEQNLVRMLTQEEMSKRGFGDRFYFEMT